jgi:hypothetical protein
MTQRGDVLIVLPETVKGLIRPLAEAAGSQRAAALKSGLSQATLSRIMTADAPYSLRERSFLRLMGWVPRRQWSVLVGATLDWDARARLQRYARWLAERTGEEKTGIVGVPGTARPFERALRRRRRESLLSALEPLFRQSFRWFERQLEEAPAAPSEARKALAYDRVFEPFYDFAESHAIELDWKELTGREGARERRLRQEQLRLILEWGMRRELLLLARPRDTVRARQASNTDWRRPIRGKSKRAAFT